MATDSLNVPSTFLQSKDHSDLLNIIDDLRSQGISHYVDLPQVIVCGDQSSGKSSVLEAVSGIRFPQKDNLCTRFATEVILRRGPGKGFKVSIVPGADRTEQERARLLKFLRADVDLDEFETLVQEARDVMGIDLDNRAFSTDILRVEISGPSQPHLTLVDLPGLFQAGNKAQSDDDARAVTLLVLSYMRKTRSIILAVVSAKNDFANQIVTKYAREIDPDGLRTLGIITKPDTLHEGSESEQSFVELAENRDVRFRLGWHVVRNRDYDTRHYSMEQRDDMERDFFSKGLWARLPRRHVGIASLKSRLSTLLRDQILLEMPSLVMDVEIGIDGCKETMSRLGASRSTLQEQRTHLLRISQDFASLAKSAIDGVYNDSFFGSASTEIGYKKRLRAVIQNTLLEFAATMRQRGHTKHIVDQLTAKKRTEEPRFTTREEFIDDVLVLMKRTRGRELPGMYNPNIVADLFYEQSKTWHIYVHQFSTQIWEATMLVLNLILDHTADKNTAAGLRRHIVNPAMDALRKKLKGTADTVLAPHRQGHPITYNHDLVENIEKMKGDHQRRFLAKKLDDFFGTNSSTGMTFCQSKSFDVKILLNSITQTKISNMDRYACSEVIDCMKAYYKVSPIRRISYDRARSQASNLEQEHDLTHARSQ